MHSNIIQGHVQTPWAPHTKILKVMSAFSDRLGCINVSHSQCISHNICSSTPTVFTNRRSKDKNKFPVSIWEGSRQSLHQHFVPHVQAGEPTEQPQHPTSTAPERAECKAETADSSSITATIPAVRGAERGNSAGSTKRPQKHTCFQWETYQIFLVVIRGVNLQYLCLLLESSLNRNLCL